MARLSLSLLGPLKLELDKEPITGLKYAKVRALLAYLAVEADRPHRRGSLAGLLWPERPERAARGNLRNALSNLRQTLGDHDAAPPYLLVSHETIQFNCASDHWLDVEAFQALVNAAHMDTLALEEAIALYRGPFLEGLSIAHSPAYEDWAYLVRERLQRQASIAFSRLIAHHEQRGDLERACAYAWRRVELEPWQEEAHRGLMHLLALSGQRSGALAQYEVCRRVLREELDVEPSGATTRLYEQIRDGVFRPRPSLSSPDDVEAMSLPFLTGAPLTTEEPLFVAREREQARLEAHLCQALSGRGRVILVTGEAGQGKTALIQAFAGAAASAHPDLVVAGGNCNAYTGIGDPYLPFREILGLLTGDVEARWVAGTIGEERARRLWRTLPLACRAVVADGPDLVDAFLPGAALTGRARACVPGQTDWLERLEEIVLRQARRSSASSLRQDDLFEQYTAVLQAVARRVPLLLVLDDLQWADLGSIGLLFHLGRRLEGSRILVVGAYRSEEVAMGRGGERHPLEPIVYEFKRDWGNIEIDLGQAEGRQFVDAFLDSEPNCLDTMFRETLYRQTRGHPLFTVELLRGMQERGDLVRDVEGRWIEGPVLDWETLPARVEAVIAERIGRLDEPSRSILRVASVEGEVFTAQVVAQAQAVDERNIVTCLSGELDRQHRLVRAEGIIHMDDQRLSRYRFRHILFQKYMYSSLDVVMRAQLHERVGGALEALLEALDAQHAEAMAVAPQLAWHFEQADMLDKAITYLQRAGERAVRLSANEEAVAHLTRGLSLLESLPDTPEQAQRELVLQLALAAPLQELKGYAASEVGHVLARARELCQQIGETPRVITTLGLLNVLYGVGAAYQTALELGEQVLALAQRAQDPAFIALGHFLLGWVLVPLGDFCRSQAHLQHMVDFYDPQRHRHLASATVVDPGVCAHAWMAWDLWFLGYPDQASKQSQEALALARELDYPYFLAFALSVAGAQLHIFCREYEVACEWAEAEIALAAEERFAFHQVTGMIHRGSAQAGMGQVEEGIAQIRRGLEVAEGAYLTSWLGALSEAYGWAGQAQNGLDALNEAFALVEKTGERYYEAELHRLKGELLLIQDSANQAEAEICYRQAIEVARRQRAKSWELRAAMSLSRLWQRQGKTIQACEMLAKVYNWFTEGFDTPDLGEARALLDVLARDAQMPVDSL